MLLSFYDYDHDVWYDCRTACADDGQMSISRELSTDVSDNSCSDIEFNFDAPLQRVYTASRTDNSKLNTSGIVSICYMLCIIDWSYV